MEFRPCIDIHNGKVKQIVGSTLKDEGDQARENFVSSKDAAFYAGMYRDNHLKGGHIILLNPSSSPFYEDTKREAIKALHAYPGGMQIGGGIRGDNAGEYMKEGASHVIVTSYVFSEGEILMERIRELNRKVGKEHLVLDLSCRRCNEGYVVTTDRWQKDTNRYLNLELMEELEGYCGEFLIHAVDVEGKANGIEEELVTLLSGYDGNPVTYAGGIHNLEELRKLKRIGKNKIHATVGSALDLFGGSMKFEDVVSLAGEE